MSSNGARRAPGREFSAGGVLTRKGKVLLVRMLTPRGEWVWTFPKGHQEGAEPPRRAALREVVEESGYACRILKPLAVVRYSFWRGPRRIAKRVRWYWMEPGPRVGRPDPREISGVRWLAPGHARSLLRYPADFRLLEKVRRLGGLR